MLGRFAFALALTVSLQIHLARVALAQETGDDDRAREAFTLGSRAFDDRRWDDAARYFQRAYELSARPALLYNLGATYERMGDRARAIDAFERYLRELPDAENVAEVEERLHTLRAGLAERSDDDEAEGGAGPAPWIVLGVGVAAAGAGIAFLALANGARDRVESAPMGTYWDTVEGDASNASTFSVVGAVLLGIGGGAIVGGLVWALVGGGSSESASVAIGPGSITLRGHF